MVSARIAEPDEKVWRSKLSLKQGIPYFASLLEISKIRETAKIGKSYVLGLI